MWRWAVPLDGVVGNKRSYEDLLEEESDSEFSRELRTDKEVTVVQKLHLISSLL